MRSSELLGRRVLTPGGAAVGVVHDVRLARRGRELAVTSVVVGPDTWRCAAAHVWGIAQDRTAGPALLRRLLAASAARARVVPVRDVLAWDHGGALLVAEHTVAGDR